MTNQLFSSLLQTSSRPADLYKNAVLYKCPGKKISKEHIKLLDFIHKNYKLVNPYLPRFLNSHYYSFDPNKTSPYFFHLMLTRGKFRLLKDIIKKYRLIDQSNVMDCTHYCLNHYKNDLSRTEIPLWLKSNITPYNIKPNFQNILYWKPFLNNLEDNNTDEIILKMKIRSLSILLDHLPHSILKTNGFIPLLEQSGYSYHQISKYFEDTKFI